MDRHEDHYDDRHPPQESFRERAQRPADVLRDGALKATIWKNSGEKGPYFTTTLAKTYEDRNGKPRDTHSFSGSDLLRVAELARDAYARSNQLRRDLGKQRSQEAAQDRREDAAPDSRSSYRGRRARDERSAETPRQARAASYDHDM